MPAMDELDTVLPDGHLKSNLGLKRDKIGCRCQHFTNTAPGQRSIYLSLELDDGSAFSSVRQIKFLYIQHPEK